MNEKKQTNHTEKTHENLHDAYEYLLNERIWSWTDAMG